MNNKTPDQPYDYLIIGSGFGGSTVYANTLYRAKSEYFRNPVPGEKYIRSITMPAVEAGLTTSGRTREALNIVGSPFIVAGQTEEEFKQAQSVGLKV